MANYQMTSNLMDNPNNDPASRAADALKQAQEALDAASAEVHKKKDQLKAVLSEDQVLSPESPSDPGTEGTSRP
jgi:hypothetical protein